jgi:carbohydrate diacid regulator
LQAALALGVDLLVPRVALVIDATDYIQTSKPISLGRSKANMRMRVRVHPILECLQSYFSSQRHVLYPYRGRGEIAVLVPTEWNADPQQMKGASPDGASYPGHPDFAALKQLSQNLVTRLESEVGAKVSIGIGKYFHCVEGLEWSHHSARFALRFGEDLHKRDNVYCLDDMLITAFLHSCDNRSKAELSRYMICPLESDPALLQTLEVFLEDDCCLSAAALHLRMHRNTLSYRLDKIAALTSLDPRRFEQAVQLRLALDFYKSRVSLVDMDSDA